MSMRYSDLVGAEVVSEGGDRIGHVFDVRVRRRAGSSPESAAQTWRLVGLVLGRRGLWERLGIARAPRRAFRSRRDLLPWDQVLALEWGRVVARDHARVE